MMMIKKAASAGRLSRHKPAGILGLVALLLLAGSAGASAATASDLSRSTAIPAQDRMPAGSSDTGSDDERLLDQSRQLRHDQGFGTESAQTSRAILVQRSLGQPLTELVNEWGFIGSPEEAATMARRELLLRLVDDELTQWRDSEEYAGDFIDTSRDATLVIQFTAGAIPASLKEPLDVFEDGARVGLVEAREVLYSSTTLDAALRSVWDVSPKETVSVSEDVKANALTIALAEGASEDLQERIAAQLKVPHTFTRGEGLEEACTSRNQCNSPQRGGVGLESGGSVCSAGWVVHRNGASGMVTAGHCWFGSNSGTIASGSAGTYGTKTSLNALDDAGTHADMRYISVTNARPWLYQNDSNMSRVVTGTSSGSVGGVACLFGRNSPSPRCGTISTKNASHWSATAGVTVYGQHGANYSSSGGDSGGAIGSSTTGALARGVHSGVFDGVKHYSWIGYSSTYNLGNISIG